MSRALVELLPFTQKTLQIKEEENEAKFSHYHSVQRISQLQNDPDVAIVVFA